MRSHARYVPVDQVRGSQHVMLDSLPVAGTVLTLSHWPGAVNPIPIESDTSTGIVLDFLRQGGTPADVGACTAVHFDIDGLLSLHVAVNGDAGLDVGLVRDLARAGDFGTASTARARRGAFALDAATVAVRSVLTLPHGPQRTAAVYRRMLVWLDEHFEALQVGPLPGAWWGDRERQYERSAVLLDSERVAWHRLAGDEVRAVELHADDEALPALDSRARLYFGLDQYALHERCPALAILLSHGGRHQLVQRYEGWVQGHDPTWARRRDLAPLCDYLRSCDADGDWRYGGVYHPFAQLETGPERVSTISAERLRALVAKFHETAPVAWHPHLID
jgi:hypothetical protein